jgi:CRP-like cAMP-binding protein
LADATRAPVLIGNPVLAQSDTANQILATLPRADFALLQPYMEKIELPVRRQIELRQRPVEHVYFFESGLASMVVSAGANHNIEVGIVGNEGMTGLPILMSADRPIHETFIQTAGFAHRLTAERFRGALTKSPNLHGSLLRYAHTLIIQMAYTALANGRYTIEERLARWLLMAVDRAKDNTIFLTHDFLALMLGTRRAGVTNALGKFEKRGIVNAQRGRITVQDRNALEEVANGSYGIPESEYRRLFGTVGTPASES